MSDDLVKLEELAKAATPGPWYRGAQNDTTFVIAGREPSPDNEFQNHDAPREAVARVTGKTDEKFIAAANPAAVLSLVARIRALEEEIRRLSEALRDDRHARALASERRVDELNAENKRLREALEPFAKKAAIYADIPGVSRINDNVELWQVQANKGMEITFTVGDLRRAAAALEKK